ncbi:MAG: bifunctional N(6)-L-threonylcarbamoyladenine synthase/serine/threonine protein kinase [Thermoplasmata archaeon]|nr:bifunctional N(6)-L-threonylcarbamoyladenine synthase/serine/threonine protein kinase [Candidatus Sysuiplasma acidicola]MDH2905882.1 bifunctional N(6)-L-threonylcarbamoyladenine synthase/serine/threonine protein kinase [Methanomassiliicoccales archaeon]
MICLGIEGTAHTVGIGIVDSGGNVLAEGSHMYRPEKGGIHPREAANHHAEHVVPLIEDTLKRSGISIESIDVIAFSQGPGLGPCLRTVATAARAISISLSKPLIGVNHCVAHLEIGRMKHAVDDPVMLYASGGNTQVIAYSKPRYRVFGETMDIGVGNMLDKFGIMAGLGFYAGPVIEKLAKAGTKLIDLPYSVKGMDVSFSGILTAAKQQLKNGCSQEDLCFSLQETVFSMLTEVTERAIAQAEKSEIVLAGGVARNRRLSQMVHEMAADRGARVFEPPFEYLVDNGVMIAWNGLLAYGSGQRMSIENSAVNQRYRTDQVQVTWR